MPDVYSRPDELDPETVAGLAEAIELRAKDPVQRGFVDAYMSRLELPLHARILEIGCGTGAIARMLALRSGVAEVVGVDPVRGLLDRARELAADFPNISFHLGDGGQLPVDDACFDAVVIHTVLSHTLDPKAVLAEARRALVPGGALVVFDGDYASLTLGVREDDPIEACAAAFRSSHINDPWIMRRAARLIEEAGFAALQVQSHGYAQIFEPSYMLTVVGRGADALAGEGVIGRDLAEALKSEARRRVVDGSFFGQVSYVSITASRPV
jgi:ubiquinone/menaquinone biosynthesis C-methylase UbiE